MPPASWSRPSASSRRAPTRPDASVVVEEQQRLAARLLGAFVAVAQEAEVLGVAHEAHAVHDLGQPQRLVRRMVVEHEHLVADALRVAEHRAQAGVGVAPLAEHRHQNRAARRVVVWKREDLLIAEFADDRLKLFPTIPQRKVALALAVRPPEQRARERAEHPRIHPMPARAGRHQHRADLLGHHREALRARRAAVLEVAVETARLLPEGADALQHADPGAAAPSSSRQRASASAHSGMRTPCSRAMREQSSSDCSGRRAGVG
jgi:hypothetical protein